jgi:hypothetical protein
MIPFWSEYSEVNTDEISRDIILGLGSGSVFVNRLAEYILL